MRVQSSGGRPSQLIANSEPVNRRGIPLTNRTRLPRPSAARPGNPLTGEKRQPAPGLKADPGPSSAAEKHPRAIEKRTPVIGHAVWFPAKSGAGDDNPVTVAGKIGEAVTIFGIIGRVIRYVLHGVAVSLLNGTIAIGGPTVEI